MPDDTDREQGLQAARVILPDFNGERSAATVWYAKFNLLKDRFKWSPDECLVHLGVRLNGNSGVWFASLSETVRANWDQVREQFEREFIKDEHQMVLMSKLQKLKFGVNDDIQDYYSEILSLGSKLNRSTEDIASNFIAGLPESMSRWVLTTDTHTLSSYLARAKLYLARWTADKNVSFPDAGVFNISDSMQGFEDRIVHLISEKLGDLSVSDTKLQPQIGSGGGRTQSGDRHSDARRDSSRARSTSRSNDTERSRANDRSRSYSRDRYERGRYDRSTSGDRYRTGSGGRYRPSERERSGRTDQYRSRSRGERYQRQNDNRGRTQGRNNANRRGRYNRGQEQFRGREKPFYFPANGLCWNCGVSGHIARHCRANQNNYPSNYNGGQQGYYPPQQRGSVQQGRYQTWQQNGAAPNYPPQGFNQNYPPPDQHQASN